MIRDQYKRKENELFENYNIANSIIEHFKKRHIFFLLNNVAITDKVLEVLEKLKTNNSKFRDIFNIDKNEIITIETLTTIINKKYEINDKTLKEVSKWKNKEKHNFIASNINEENKELFEKHFNKITLYKCLNFSVNGNIVLISILYKYTELFENCKLSLLEEYAKILNQYYAIKFPSDNIYLNKSSKYYDELYQYFEPINIKVWEEVFCYFCKSGNLKNAKDVLEKSNIDHSCKGCYPFIKSLEYGNLEIAEWLYSLEKYELNLYDYMLLKNVAFYGEYECFIWLFNKIGDIPYKKLNQIEIRCIEGKKLGERCREGFNFNAKHNRILTKIRNYRKFNQEFNPNFKKT